MWESMLRPTVQHNLIFWLALMTCVITLHFLGCHFYQTSFQNILQTKCRYINYPGCHYRWSWQLVGSRTPSGTVCLTSWPRSCRAQPHSSHPQRAAFLRTSRTSSTHGNQHSISCWMRIFPTTNRSILLLFYMPKMGQVSVIAPCKLCIVEVDKCLRVRGLMNR